MDNEPLSSCVIPSSVAEGAGTGPCQAEGIDDRGKMKDDNILKKNDNNMGTEDQS